MTNADRLNAIVARVGPHATYVIHSLEGTARKVVITHPDTGDAIGAVGPTITDAITALDAKVPAAQEAQ